MGILDASTGGLIASGNSAADGYFTVANIPAGIEEYVLDVVPSTLSVDLAPDGSAYAQFREEIPLIEGVTNVWERPVYLPRIAGQYAAQVVAGTTTLVDNLDLGIRMEVPPDTALDEQGQLFQGELSISEVPVALAPMALPAEFQPSTLITIQPIGVTFAQPVPITFPNTDGLSAGSEVDIYSIDPDTGQFVVVGIGRVTQDEQFIETISGGVRDASWHFILALESLFNNDNPDPCKEQNEGSGSSTAVCSGNLREVHELATYRSLDETRGLRLVYNSTSADPRPIITTNATVAVRSAVPDRISARLSVAGVDQGQELFTSTSVPALLSESIDETIRQAVQFDAGGFQTGSYPYRLSLTNHFGSSSVSGIVADTVLVNNEANSAYGAGWTLNGVQRLRPQIDRSVVITEGNGGIQLYRPDPTAENGLNMQMFSTPDPVGAVANGFAGLAPGTFTVTTVQESSAVTETSLPVVNFPDNGFDTSAFYNVGPNGVVDAGSTATVPQGDDISIQPPGGNDTFGASITGFLLLPVGGDVTFTVGVDDAFDLIVNGQSVVKFLGITDFRNFTGTAVGLPAGFVPITLNYGENGGEANIILSASGGGLPGGVIPQTSLFKTAGGVSGLPESFISPAGDFSMLATNPDASFTRTLKDGTRIEFDANGLQTAVVDLNGNTTSYAYDTQDRLISITDPADEVTTLSYVGDHLASISDPANRTTSFEHDADGNLIRITDPNGLVTTFTYDLNGLVTTVTETPPVGGGALRTTTFSYDNAGQRTQTVQPDGVVIDVTYDALGRVVDIQNNLGERNVHSYDAAGNRIQTDVFDPDDTLVSTVGRTFDSRERQLTETRPHDATQDSIIQFGYDGNGNLITRTDPNDRMTTNVYDPADRLIRTIDPLGGITEYGYDANDNLSQVTAPNGVLTQYTNDPLGQRFTEESPDRGTLTRTYDLGNNLKTVTDARGITATYSYDVLNRVTAISYPDPSEDVAFVYDTCPFGVGRMCERTDPSGTTDFEYDAYGNVTRITTTTLGVTYVTAYTYDEGQNLIVMTLPSGREVTYTRDGLSRTQAISTDINGLPTTVVEGISYRADGQVTGRLYGNAVAEFREYDLQGRLTRYSLPLVDDVVYARDPAGNVLSRDTFAQTHSYAYDGLDRLVDEVNAGQATSYAYDPNGNRLTQSGAAQTVLYDYGLNSNRLEAIDGVPLSHDAAGNRTADAQARAFDCNDAGRLENVYDGAALLDSYVYNAQGQRVHKIAPTGTTVYHYDLAGNLISETRDDGTPVKDYLWQSQTPIGQIDAGGVETLHYLHPDHLATPRLATNAAGVITWRWEGKAFGETPAEEDPDGNGLATEVNLRFPGQYLDDETGLHYNY